MLRAALVAGLAFALQGQDLAFDVASIKPSEAAATQAVGQRIMMRAPEMDDALDVNRQQVRYLRAPLSALIMRAFSLTRTDQVANMNALGGANATFDIVANVPEGTTPDQVSFMLRHLLSDRFGLRFHNEIRRKSVYVLRVGKNGPAFKESGPAPEIDPSAPQRTVGAPDDGGFPTVTPQFSGVVMRRGQSGAMLLVGQRIKLSSILSMLESGLGRQIVDATGLEGLYDFRFVFGLGQAQSTGPVPAEPVPTAEDAIRNLGLTLEGTERDIEVMVVDEVNLQPTEN